MTTGCRCFDVCSPAGLASTLLRLPQQVSSRESPWHGYLSDVYHGALPPLPFALRGRLELLYPALLPTPVCLHPNKTKHSVVQSCSADECARWMPDPPAEAARVAEFLAGRTFIMTTVARQSDRRPFGHAVLLQAPIAERVPANGWVEVMRRKAAEPEGWNGTGCWFHQAAGDHTASQTCPLAPLTRSIATCRLGHLGRRPEGSRVAASRQRHLPQSRRGDAESLLGAVVAQRILARCAICAARREPELCEPSIHCWRHYPVGCGAGHRLRDRGLRHPATSWVSPLNGARADWPFVHGGKEPSSFRLPPRRSACANRVESRSAVLVRQARAAAQLRRAQFVKWAPNSSTVSRPDTIALAIAIALATRSTAAHPSCFRRAPRVGCIPQLRVRRPASWRCVPDRPQHV